MTRKVIQPVALRTRRGLAILNVSPPQESVTVMNSPRIDRLVLRICGVSVLTVLTAVPICAQSLTRGRSSPGDASGRTATQTPLDHIVISAPSATLYSGATLAHIAKGVWKDGREGKLAGAIWRSSDPAVATVDKTGNVTARKAGIVTITAEVEGVRGSKTYAVTPRPAERTLIDLPGKPMRSGDTV